MKILGVNRRAYPAQDHLHENNEVIITVVLVGGDANDYAAYAGHGVPEFVAMKGTKLSFQEACLHFPGGQLKLELYRD